MIDPEDWRPELEESALGHSPNTDETVYGFGEYTDYPGDDYGYELD